MPTFRMFAAAAAAFFAAGSADAQIYGPLDFDRSFDRRGRAARDLDFADRLNGRRPATGCRAAGPGFDVRPVRYGEPLGRRGAARVGRGFTVSFGRPAIAPVSLPAVDAYSNDFARLEDLAAALEASANALCLDLHFNYGHNHDFERMYAQAYELFAAAGDVRAAGRAGDGAFVRSRLAGLDGLFYAVETRLAGWSRAEVTPVGPLCLDEKLARTGQDLRRLMAEVGVPPVPLSTPLTPPLPTVAPAPGTVPPTGLPADRFAAGPTLSAPTLQVPGGSP